MNFRLERGHIFLCEVATKVETLRSLDAKADLQHLGLRPKHTPPLAVRSQPPTPTRSPSPTSPAPRAHAHLRAPAHTHGTHCAGRSCRVQLSYTVALRRVRAARTPRSAAPLPARPTHPVPHARTHDTLRTWHTLCAGRPRHVRHVAPRARCAPRTHVFDTTSRGGSS